MSARALEGLEGVRRALDAAAAAGAHSADAVLIAADSVEARVRGDEIDFVKQSRERTLGIRAFVKGSQGLRSAVTSTSDLSAEGVDRMGAETVELASATAEDPDAGLPEGGFATELPDLGLLDPADRKVPIERRIADARSAEASARGRDPRITNSEGSEVGSDFAHVAYGNSEGFFGEYETGRHGLFSMPVASENGTMQTDYWSTVGRRLGDLESAEAVGRRAAERALRRLGSRRIRTCEVPVVFEPMVARSLIGHLVSCVSGSAVYRQASYLAGRLGETVASPLVTVIDDGRLPRGLGSRPFDGEGQPTRRTTVIEKGRFQSYLLDGYAARKLGLASTGNASRSAGGTPSAGPTNFWLEPGEGGLEDIVADTERGLLVTWLFGHGFNPVSGDFSRGAAGLWIEDGRLSQAVDEITIAGHFGDVLAGIDRVGEDLLWLGSVAAPSLRVARMTVAGE